MQHGHKDRRRSLTSDRHTQTKFRTQVLLDWTDDVDALWIEALQTLEDNRELSEDALEFLDTDPLSLFGIADPVTQKALEKAATVPMLKCMGQQPCLEEW